MIRIIGLVMGLAFFIESGTLIDERSGPMINPLDSVAVDTYPVYDSLGLLDGYQAYIFTPICEKNICYAVEIEFSWDAIGRFIRYDTIPGQGLTKLDHIPFEQGDYDRLQSILSNPNSILAKYTRENLVKDTRKSEVDGVTGATIQEVKDNVIEGAVYSCYTLWHLAHGPVVDSIQQKTIAQFSKGLIQKLVDQDNQEINYFLIKHFTSEDFVKYLPEILKTIENGRGYYPKNAMQQMPAQIVMDSLTQQFLVKNFSKMDYFSQIEILKKLTKQSLDIDLSKVLKMEMSDRESYRNELIKGLVEN